MGLFSKDKQHEATSASQPSTEAAPPAYQQQQGQQQELLPQENAPAYSRPGMASASTPEGSHSTALMPPFLTTISSLAHLHVSHLGPNDKDKRYCVENHTKETLLHAGPDKSSPIFARVNYEKDGSHYGASAISVPQQDGETVRALMTGDHSNRQPFSVQLGKTLHHFEWRQSTGDEVVEVGRTRLHGYGWKLVWLTGDVSGEGGKRKEREYGFASDGREIVAVASMTSKLLKGPNFSFMGTGLTGALGPVFELVAVAGFVRLFNLQAMRSQHGGAPWYYNKEEHPGMAVPLQGMGA